MKNMYFKKFVAMSMATTMIATSMYLPAFAEQTTGTEVVTNGSTNAVGAVQTPDTIEQTPDQGIPAENGVIYTHKDIVSTDVNFPSPLDWSKSQTVKVENSTEQTVFLNRDFNMTTDILIDEAGYQTLLKKGTLLKVKGAVQVGRYFTWNEDANLKTLARSSFEKTEDGYKATLSFSLRGISAGSADEFLTLEGINFILFGDGFQGKVRFANIQLTELPGLVYMAPLSKDATLDIDFSNMTQEDWGSSMPTTVIVKNLNTGMVNDMAAVTGNIIIDEAMYQSIKVSGSYLKLRTVMKLGPNYSWNEGHSYIYLNSSSFKKNTDGTYVASFADSHTIDTPNCLQEILVRVAGVKAKGTVRFSKVAVYNAVKEENTVPEKKDPTIMDDFDSDEIGANAGWQGVKGTNYEGNPTPVVDDVNGTKALMVDVDYTNSATSTWSEANVKKYFETGYDVSCYNKLTYDMIYPEEFSKFRARVVAEDTATGDAIVASEASIGRTVTLANGMKKSTMTVTFKAKRAEITQLTISTVGVQTAFKGDIYLDTITLGQYSSVAEDGDCATENDTVPSGHIANITSDGVIKDAMPIQAYVKNAKSVQIMIKNGSEEVVLQADEEGTEQSDGKGYVANLDAETIEKIGNTSSATVLLIADGEVISELSPISFEVEQKDTDTSTIKKPVAVTGVKAKVTDTKVLLSWKAVKQVTGYQIERYDTAKKKYVKVATTKKTSLTDSKRKAGTTYQYRICAYTQSGKTVVKGTYSKVLKVSTAPAKVGKVTVKAKKAKTVTVSWKKATGASGYVVYRAEKKNGTYKKVGAVKKTSYIDKKIKAGKKYFYMVRAYKTVNKKPLYGAKSSMKSVSIKKK